MPSLHAILDRHAQRRASGTPTLSVLAGPVGLGYDAWRHWAASRGVGAVPVSVIERTAVAEVWLAHFATPDDLTGAALAFVAARTGRTAADLRAGWPNRSLHERTLLLDHVLPVTGACGAEALCRSLLLTDRPPRGPGFLHAWADDGLFPDRIIGAVAELIPPTHWPGLLLHPSDPSPPDPAAWLDAAARLLTQWAGATPALPVAVAASAADVYRYLEMTPESHAKALVREGLVPVVGLTAEAVRERVATAMAWPGSVARLAADGVTAELAEAFGAAARCAAEPATAAEDDQARSAAEWFLFERLESLSATAGLFRLNATPGPRRPSGHAVEIDLCAESLKLAVEIDGYYHFRDPEAYRRDRRKDVLLQRHGYFVLRVLAQDVAPRLEQVLDAILEAVVHRRGRACSEGGS